MCLLFGVFLHLHWSSRFISCPSPSCPCPGLHWWMETTSCSPIEIPAASGHQWHCCAAFRGFTGTWDVMPFLDGSKWCHFSSSQLFHLENYRWNLVFSPVWKGSSSFPKPSFSGSMLIFQGVSTGLKKIQQVCHFFEAWRTLGHTMYHLTAVTHVTLGWTPGGWPGGWRLDDIWR